MKNSGISVLERPAKTPDLNIIEDCWKTIKDLVYDGYRFQNKAELVETMTNVIFNLNQGQRKNVLNLYNAIRGRLCIVLEKHDDLCNR